jgi:hypothetical protein
MSKTIFLSHIHEECELAALIKDALEEEFSGFVSVFVSSDGVSIPAGANFLKRIEDGLVECIGALYLISPESVCRNWINFELGAVWIRNAISIRAGGVEVPTIPICHSGISPGALPSPLNNLNGITANQASQLEFAFRSLQSAVGGKGKLRSDFDAIASRIAAFEQSYTFGANLARMLRLIFGNLQPIIHHCESQPNGSRTTINCGFLETSVVQRLQSMAKTELGGQVQVKTGNSGITFGVAGAVNGAEVELTVPVDLICRFKANLLEASQSP